MAKQFTDKEKKKIIAYYVDCANYSKTARKFNTSDTTIRRIVKGNKSTLEKVEKKKQENTKSVLEAMDRLANVKIEIIDETLSEIKKRLKDAPLRDLNNTYGIMVDKELKMKELEYKQDIKTEVEEMVNDNFENAMLKAVKTIENPKSLVDKDTF